MTAVPGHHHMPPGHDKHAGHSVAMFRDKFWLSLALTVPVVLLSDDVQLWFGYEIPRFPGSESLGAILGTVPEATAPWYSDGVGHLRIDLSRLW